MEPSAEAEDQGQNPAPQPYAEEAYDDTYIPPVLSSAGETRTITFQTRILNQHLVRPPWHRSRTCVDRPLQSLVVHPFHTLSNLCIQ